MDHMTFETIMGKPITKHVNFMDLQSVKFYCFLRYICLKIEYFSKDHTNNTYIATYHEKMDSEDLECSVCLGKFYKVYLDVVRFKNLYCSDFCTTNKNVSVWS